jgi:hypothetical protein
VRITQIRTATLALFDPHGRTLAWRIASENVGHDLAQRPTAPLPDYLPGEHRVLVVSHAAELPRAA